MVKRIGFLYACLLLASPVAAGTIVTWEATGEVTGVRQGTGFPTPLPPLGTPVSITMTFAPSEATPTVRIGGPQPGCMTVPISASMTIGGHTWTGGGAGFTQAQLPGDTCGQTSELTQFSLHALTPPPDHPWQSDHPLATPPPFLFILSYHDLLVHDAFPEVPTTLGARLFTGHQGGPVAWHLNEALDLRAVNQPAPIPEPGTLTLLGIGLAAVARARNRRT